MAHPPSKNVKPPPTLLQLQTTLTSLTTASSILQGFAHRNKNQHRGARWWGPFNMLSRSIHKLLPDLERAVQRAKVLSSSSMSHSSSAKRRKTDKDGQGVAVRQPELDKFAERAQWLHNVIGPEAYDAFTQLTTDKQFAQLGLVLIGVLAQVEDAIAPFVAQDATEASDAAMTKLTEVINKSEIALPETAPSIGIIKTSGYDLGVAIARDELDNNEGPRSPVEQSTSQLKEKKEETPSLEDPEPTRKTSKDRDRKKVKARADFSNPGKNKKTHPMEVKGVAKVEKKKTKKKGGDEFDDLFSSLL